MLFMACLSMWCHEWEEGSLKFSKFTEPVLHSREHEFKRNLSYLKVGGPALAQSIRITFMAQESLKIACSMSFRLHKKIIPRYPKEFSRSYFTGLLTWLQAARHCFTFSRLRIALASDASCSSCCLTFRPVVFYNYIPAQEICFYKLSEDLTKSLIPLPPCEASDH